MNNCSFIGRLTNDPEIRTTNTGKKVLSICIAVPDGKEQTDFIDCVAWEKNAETIANYFKKGNRIGIVGKMKTRTYEKDNKKVKVTECLVGGISFIESKTTEKPIENNNWNVQPMEEAPAFDIQRDDLPF